MQVQTRSWQGEIKYFPTVKEAFKYADATSDVWKVSFDLPGGERARFIRDPGNPLWKFEDLMTRVKAQLLKQGLSNIADVLVKPEQNNELL